jgi:EAL domain-containing protein (putative c-di-GMP-specific phosphodiesterase class I)
MDNPEQASQILGDLREMGVRLALDDFGTGYSSLSHLQRFPFDTIKIDRSFVKRLEADEQNRAIVRTIIGLADSLKMDVVAEGVETPAQLQLIRELGCRFGQGWHFARPLEDTAAGELIGSNPSW